MATRTVRQARIAELIDAEQIHNQKDLLGKLKKDGIEITQATLSRDLRKLGAAKTRAGYAMVTDNEHAEPGEGLRHIFREFVRHVDSAGSIVVLKTGPSNAPAVAVAIDRVAWPEVLGTVAGEDTLFALVKTSSQAGKIVKRIKEILK